MNYKMMGKFIGRILIVEAVFMVPAMLISLWEKEFASVIAFMWSLGALLVAAGALLWLGRGSQKVLRKGGAGLVWA